MKKIKDFNLKSALEEVADGQDIDQLTEELASNDLSSEEIEYCTEEINKGLEAICSLNDLKSTLEKQETNNVAIESYAELAVFGYNNIIRNIGLEKSTLFLEPDKDGVYSSKSSLSEKVKAAIEKIIEIIKRIVAKILEFVKGAFKTVTDKTAKAKKSFENLIQDKALELIKKGSVKTIDINSPRFYKDHRLVDIDMIYSSFIVSATSNIDQIKQVAEKLKDHVLSPSTPKSLDEQIKDLNKDNEKFISSLKGKKSTKYGVKVTPEGYIDLFVSDEENASVITFTKHDPDDIVEKQVLALVGLRISSMETSLNKFKTVTEENEKVRIEITKLMEDRLDNNLKSLKEAIDKADSSEKEDLLNIARGIKLYLTQLNNLLMTVIKYENDLANMLIFYNHYIEQAVKKSQ